MTNEEPLYIGARGGEQRWFLGVLDELYVYAAALTDEQVKVLYEGNEILHVDETPDDGGIVPPTESLATQWSRIRSGLVVPVVED